MHVHSLKAQLIRLFMILFGVFIVHTIAMVWLEKLSWMDSIWLTVTTATTVGYGDLAASTPYGRMVTIGLLYIGGIAILAQLASLFFEYKQEVRYNMLTGHWSWSMKNHLVFLHAPDQGGEQYFMQAISHLRQSSCNKSNLPVVIVSENYPDGIPDKLRAMDVVHVTGDVHVPDTFKAANVKDAHTIVLISPHHNDPHSDSLNFDLLHRLRDMGVKARIIVEVVFDENRARFLRSGADNVIRPIRIYPELLVRTILAPGSEQLIETILDSKREECIRYDANVQARWGDIVAWMIEQDLGVPLSYLSKEDTTVSNPSANDTVNATALFVLAKKERIQSDKAIQTILSERFDKVLTLK